MLGEQREAEGLEGASAQLPGQAGGSGQALLHVLAENEGLGGLEVGNMVCTWLQFIIECQTFGLACWGKDVCPLG